MTRAVLYKGHSIWSVGMFPIALAFPSLAGWDSWEEGKVLTPRDSLGQ